jgi:hypothetical protein
VNGNALFTTRWQGRPVVFNPSASIAPIASVTEKTDSGRSQVGGLLCDAIYRVAHDWAYSRFVTGMADVSVFGDAVTVELCHTWRITQVKSGAVNFTRWHPLEKIWEGVDATEVPDLKLFVRPGHKASLARKLIHEACDWYIGVAADALCRAMEEYPTQNVALVGARRLAAEVLRKDRELHKVRFEPLADAGGVVGGALWKLIDRNVVSNVCRIHLHPTLRDYAAVVDHDAGLCRVSAEHRNLLPLLRVVPPTKWHDSNLFAHYRWKEAATAPIQIGSAGQPAILQSKLAWRYFVGAPAPLHASWLGSLERARWRMPFSLVYEVFARTRVTAQTLWKTRVIRAIESRSFLFEVNISDADLTTLAHLIDCFFNQARLLQANCGWRQAIGALTSDDLRNVLDWWHGEGRHRALPDKQSTWVSVERAVNAWEQIQRHGDSHATWVSALGTVRIDDVDVIPLDTGKKLIEEGETMHHCVGDYIEVCRGRDDQRIFSLRCGDVRSTLRIAKQLDDWGAAENLAYCNARPADVLRLVGPMVARAYAAAEAKTPDRHGQPKPESVG